MSFINSSPGNCLLDQCGDLTHAALLVHQELMTPSREEPLPNQTPVNLQSQYISPDDPDYDPIANETELFSDSTQQRRQPHRPTKHDDPFENIVGTGVVEEDLSIQHQLTNSMAHSTTLLHQKVQDIQQRLVGRGEIIEEIDEDVSVTSKQVVAATERLFRLVGGPFWSSIFNWFWAFATLTMMLALAGAAIVTTIIVITTIPKPKWL